MCDALVCYTQFTEPIQKLILYLVGFVCCRLGRDGRGGSGRGGGVWAGLWQTLVLVLARRLAGCCTYRDVLNSDTMRGDVVNLAWRGYVNQIIGLNFNLISGWQECVEPHDEVWMALEELGHTADDSRSVYAVVTEEMMVV